MADDIPALEALVPQAPAPVRVPPAPLARLGPLALAVALGSASGGGGEPLTIFRTLGRDARLFRSWLVYSGRLLLRGRLPRRDTELVILRVAARTGSGYEWRQHVRIALRSGLSAPEVAAAAGPVGDEGLSPRQRVLLAATDELLDRRAFGDATWSALSTHLDRGRTIELCLLVGHYQGLATALGGLGVPPESAPNA